MLSKGSELFMFESDFFKLKQKYINEEVTDEMWHRLMEDGDTLLKKYRSNDTIEYYCFQSFCTFVDFLDARKMGRMGYDFKMRPGLLELRS